jgi:hypothetical protein
VGVFRFFRDWLRGDSGLCRGAGRRGSERHESRPQTQHRGAQGRRDAGRGSGATRSGRSGRRGRCGRPQTEVWRPHGDGLLSRRLRRQQSKGPYDLLRSRPAWRHEVQVPARQRVRGLVRDALLGGDLRGGRRCRRHPALHADGLHPDDLYRLRADRRHQLAPRVHDLDRGDAVVPESLPRRQGHPLAVRRHGLGRDALLQARVGLHQRLFLLEPFGRGRRGRGHHPRQRPPSQLRRVRRRRRADVPGRAHPAVAGAGRLRPAQRPAAARDPVLGER